VGFLYIRSTPDRIARPDRDLIYGVHLCDSLPFTGGIPNEAILRDVPPGSGTLDLQSWVDAVKATGFTGWWRCELFCNRQHQHNSYDVANDLKSLMERLILSDPPRSPHHSASFSLLIQSHRWSAPLGLDHGAIQTKPPAGRPGFQILLAIGSQWLSAAAWHYRLLR
jgi:hypothetical protein